MKRLIIALVISATWPASAQSDLGLPIRPGMTFADIEARLKPTCLRFEFNYGSGDAAKRRSIQCYRADGPTPNTPEVVTVSITADDRTRYIQWRKLNVGGPADTAAIARSLGFGAPAGECEIFRENVPCWKDVDGVTLYDGGYDAKDAIHSFFLKKDGIE